MQTLLSLALLLTAALVSASSACSSDYTAGESSCPCRDSVDLSNFLNSEGTALRTATNDHVLPTDYGLLLRAARRLGLLLFRLGRRLLQANVVLGRPAQLQRLCNQEQHLVSGILRLLLIRHLRLGRQLLRIRNV